MNSLKNKGVSFIIPCYNCAKTLAESLNSIIHLDLVNYEICLVDDCSTDTTSQVISTYLSKYPKIIKTIKNTKNLGGGATRNVCVSLSSYKYIFCLDSDNYLDKKSFLSLWSLVREDTKAISFGEIKFFSDFLFLDINVKKWVFGYSKMLLPNLLHDDINPVASGNYLYTRDLFDSIKGYDEDLGALDAYSFGYKIIRQGIGIEIVPNTFYYHRLNMNSYWVRETANNERNRDLLCKRYPIKETQHTKKIIKGKIIESSILKIFKYITKKHG